MANLSNINNKFIVQDNSRILVNTTSDTGATLQVGGSFSTTTSVRVGDGVLYVGNGTNTTARIMGFGDYEMITGVSGATYLRVSGSNTLAGTLQAGQYILATGLAYGAVNSYTQIIDGSTGAITGTTASFVSAVAGTTAVISEGNYAANGSVKLYEAKRSGGAVAGDWSYDDTTTDMSLGTSTAHSFSLKTGNTRALTIDSSQNATFAGDITLQAAGSTGLIIRTTDNTEPFLALQRNSGSNGVGVLRLLDGGDLTFDTGATGAGQSTRLTIDGATGDVLMGNTVVNPASGFSNQRGFGYDNSTGNLQIASTSGNAFVVGRNEASDGNIIELRKESNIIGALGSNTTAGNPLLDISGSSSNGNIRFVTNGAEVMRITSAYNVGIGTQDGTGDVNAKLHVYKQAGDNTVQELLRLDCGENNHNVGKGGAIVFRDINVYTDTAKIIAQRVGNSGGSTLQFSLRNSEIMRMKSDGKVGIGTDSPVAKFEVTDGASSITLQEYNNGAAIFLDGVNGDFTGGDYFHILADGADYLGLGGYGGGATPLNITNSGNVVIGNTTVDNPNSLDKVLEIEHGGSVGVILNDSRDTPIGLENRGAVFHLTHNTNSRLVVNGATGYVGINDTNPLATLSVISTSSTYPTQTIINAAGGADGYVFQRWQYVSGNTNFRCDVKQKVTSGVVRYAFDLVNNGVAHNNNLVLDRGNVGIGEVTPNYNLEIGGVSNPVVAIVSNINSATSKLYFGDSDSKDRGQVAYTHFGDFMELKAGGVTRVYIESGINTAYTADGLYNGNATPSYWTHNNAQFKIGYMDNGSGLYSGAYSFQVKSTDGIPVTGREIGAIYINDQSNSRKPLIISNQGRININQTNTSTGLASTGWIDIRNGTSAYNFFNYYTGTDGTSGCARYRVDNTSPSFFDFYYSTTQVGYITTNGTDIFYANTSDYRLKEDLKDFNGTSLLEQIQVYDFKWKESDNRMYGVVAHELQEIVPQAVVGEKDEDKLQAVDYSKLVPVLIKSIQELKAEIELLKNS